MVNRDPAGFNNNGKTSPQVQFEMMDNDYNNEIPNNAAGLGRSQQPALNDRTESFGGMQRGRSGSNASALSSVQEVENFFLRANKLAPWKQGSTRAPGKGGQSLAIPGNMSNFESRDDRASMQLST